MRLSLEHQKIIKTACKTTFGEETEIFLFGSRVDDSKLGGDIDLYIKTIDKTSLHQKKRKFMVELYSKLGEQKIDVIFNEDETRQIEQEAIKWGIPL